MKFTTQLLSILAASSVLSYTVKRQETDENIESLRDITTPSEIPDISNFDLSQLTQIDLSFLGINKNEQCDNALKEYNDCLAGMNEIEDQQKDTICGTFNSEKCQNFFKNGVKSVKGCENLEDMLLRIEEFLVEANSVSLKMQCAKDENGQYCPLSNLSTQLIKDAKNKENNNDEEFKQKYNEAVNNTCKSRTCIDAALEFEKGTTKLEADVKQFKTEIEGVINFIGAAQDMPMFNPRAKFAYTLEKVDETMLTKTSEYLQSEECSAQAPKKQESSATTLKIGGVLLSAIATIFYYLA